jgi:hypothetical protein
MHPTTERTVDKPDKRFEEGGAAERIKSIREAKEVSGIDTKQGAEMCGLRNRRTDQWEHLTRGLSRYRKHCKAGRLSGTGGVMIAEHQRLE